VSDIKSEKAVSSKTIFQAGSISKSLSVLGIMKLVQARKINLDDSAESHLTRWHLPSTAFNHNLVTIERLLNHTAGLSVRAYLGFDPSSTLPSLEDSLRGNLGGVGSIGL
jgi:CubicO group peptidase (beta-lactamase class C family)